MCWCVQEIKYKKKILSHEKKSLSLIISLSLVFCVSPSFVPCVAGVHYSANTTLFLCLVPFSSLQIRCSILLEKINITVCVFLLLFFSSCFILAKKKLQKEK